MSLVALQSAFRDEIIADDDDSPPSSPGMAIYRDAYRGRLLGALEASFERTRRWTGESSFAAAACHYIISCPPMNWTLDTYGADFPELLDALFADDPEVAELAWLEWHLGQAFAAPDRPTFDVAAFDSSAQAEADWDQARFTTATGFAIRPITTNCAELWEASRDGRPEQFAAKEVGAGWLLVWRCGLKPCYRAIDPDEAATLKALAAGCSLGDVARTCDSARLGDWLTEWLRGGLLAMA